MDILCELSDEELEYMMSKFEENLPFGLKNLYFIQSAQKCKRELIKNNGLVLSEKVLPTFYTHRYGLKENCTIFGITGEENHTVWYFTFDKSLNEIRECLEKTKLIKWGTDFLFVTLHVEQIQPVFDYVSSNGVKIVENEENSYYFLPIKDAINFAPIEIPSEVKMTQLDENDAVLCNSLWKYKNEKSELWVKSLIFIHGGYALRDKFTNEILSYAIINDHLAIGVLNTVEKAKRKGYAGIVVKFIAMKLAEKGIMPHVYVNKTNDQGYKLFQKLGFRKIGDSNWILMG